MTHQRESKDQLLLRYDSTEWRERFMRLYNLTELLAECIIRKNYTVPDDLNNALVLSKYGEEVFQKLKPMFPTKSPATPVAAGSKGGQRVVEPQLTPNVARMMCFLSLTHLDVLIDVEQTDIERIEASLSSQIIAGRIRYPFVFGRELYDKAASLFPTERSSLSVAETDDLLNGSSPGVLQSGNYLAGPCGLIRSMQSRDISIYRSVPLFHCSDADCDRVHRTELATDFDAPVNKFREEFRKILDKESKEGSAWGPFIAEISGYEDEYYDEAGTATLPYLLGDGFSDVELERLTAALVSDVNTGLSEMLTMSNQLPTIEKGKFKNPLSRAEALQIILLCKDFDIVAAVDNLVFHRRIAVPPGEIRRPMVNQRVRSGAFSLQMQVSEHGVSARPSHPSFSSARFRALLSKLYEIGKQDEAELDWQLRGVEAPVRDGRLEEFYRNSNPREILRRLVFSRYSDLVTASHHLGLRLRGVGELSDDEIIDGLLWKLGYEPSSEPGLHQRFWKLHASLRRLTNEASVSTLSDVEAIRSVASNYFVALEELLLEAVVYTTWMLTTDHYVQPRRFVFDPDAAVGPAITLLNTFADAIANDSETLSYHSERTTLYALCRSFAVLASGLESLESNRESHVRPADQVPDFVPRTAIQSFPLTHTVMFLDLSERSRVSVIEQLHELSRVLISASVHDVRNSYLHFRRSQAELDQMSRALDACETVVKALEASGLAKVPFHLASTKTDAWGRSSISLHDWSGREVTFARPSRYEWAGFPGFARAQYVSPVATIGDLNEPLRFLPGVTSAFSKMWSEYPRRRAKSEESFVGDGKADSTHERHGSIRQPVVAK